LAVLSAGGIHYKTGMKIDRNILFLIEKGNNTIQEKYTYAVSSMDDMVKEIGMVKKEKSKIKRINIPGEGTDSSIRIPKLLLARNIRIG
jgi:hypothetical protein